MAKIIPNTPKITEIKMENNGSIICPLYLPKYGADSFRMTSFRLDTGADRTFMSVQSLMVDLFYTAQDIADNLCLDSDRYAIYADGRSGPLTYIIIPEIWFLGKCFRNCPVYIDGSADFDKIERDTKLKLEDIENADTFTDNSKGNLLGVEILTQFLQVFDPEKWCVDFYSIAKPFRDLCKENGIQVASMDIKQYSPLTYFKNSQTTANSAKTEYTVKEITQFGNR